MLEKKEILDVFIKTKSAIIYKYSNINGEIDLIKKFNDYNEYKIIKKYYKMYQNSDYLYKIFSFNDAGFIKMELVDGHLLKDIYDNVYERIMVMSNFFKEWVKTLTIVPFDYQDSYLCLIENQINKIENMCNNKELLNILYLYKKCIDEISDIDYTYLIHGDLNLKNIIIQEDKKIKVIDLAPIIGCFELELVRYIEDELFSNIEYFDDIINFALEKNCIAVFEKKKLLKLLRVDSFYRTFDSYFEGDDIKIINKGMLLTKKLLNWRK